MKRKLLHPMIIPVVCLLILLPACNLFSVQLATSTPQPPTETTQAPSATLIPATTTPLPIIPTDTTAPTNTQAPAATNTTQPTSTTASSSSAAGTLEHIKMLDASNGWGIGKTIGGTTDKVLVTADGGKTWTDITPAHAFDNIGADNKSAIGYFMDSKNAWVFFYNKDQTPLGSNAAVVWHTSDGGQTWSGSTPLDISKLTLAYFNPSDLVFSNAQDGALMIHLDVGMMHDYVTIYTTTDGGNNWKEVVDPTGQTLPQSCYKNGMTFIDAKTGWVAGNCEGVLSGTYFYKTTDGGATWTNQTFPAPSNEATAFTDASDVCDTSLPQFVSSSKGFVAVECKNMNTNTANGWVYSTTDGGNTWKQLSSLPVGSGKIHFLDGSNGWFLGVSNANSSPVQYKLWKTTDGGKTWTAIADTKWNASFSFVSNQVGWAVATDGTNLALVNTVNAGATWGEIKPQINTK